VPGAGPAPLGSEERSLQSYEEAEQGSEAQTQGLRSALPMQASKALQPRPPLAGGVKGLLQLGQAPYDP